MGLALDKPLGAKRGRGRGSFIDSVLDAVDVFYAEVMQHMKTWTAAPPKVRDPGAIPPGPAALVSIALSSQDGAEESVEAPAQIPDEDATAVAMATGTEDDDVSPQWSVPMREDHSQGGDVDMNGYDQDLADEAIS